MRTVALVLLLSSCEPGPVIEHRCDHLQLKSFTRECLASRHGASFTEGSAMDCVEAAERLYCQAIYNGKTKDRIWEWKDGQWHLKN